MTEDLRARIADAIAYHPSNRGASLEQRERVAGVLADAVMAVVEAERRESDERAWAAEATLAAVREYVETSDDDGIHTRETVLRLLAGKTEAEAMAERYDQMVNAPLAPATVEALNRRLASGEYAQRKVRGTVRPAGKEPAEMVIPPDELAALCDYDETERP